MSETATTSRWVRVYWDVPIQCERVVVCCLFDPVEMEEEGPKELRKFTRDFQAKPAFGHWVTDWVPHKNRGSR